jgi:hypothetical protein
MSADIKNFDKGKISKETPKTLEEYVREQERMIDKISKSMQRGLKELLGAQTEKEVKERMDYLVFLGKSLDALIKKIEGAGIGANNKRKLLKKINLELQKVKAKRQGYEEALAYHLAEKIPKERLREKKDKKRKAIRINTRRNVR